jgi:hypothetical protein
MSQKLSVIQLPQSFQQGLTGYTAFTRMANCSNAGAIKPATALGDRKVHGVNAGRDHGKSEGSQCRYGAAALDICAKQPLRNNNRLGPGAVLPGGSAAASYDSYAKGPDRAPLHVQPQRQWPAFTPPRRPGFAPPLTRFKYLRLTPIFGVQ